MADALLEIGQRDDKLVVLVGDISHGILQPYAKGCPGRYYNVGIMEQTIVGMAAGLAISGMRPVVHTIAPFLVERCYEQLKLDFGYQQLGGVFIGVGGAFDYSGLGCSHHSYAACKLMESIPGSQVFVPGSPAEFRELFLQVYDKPKLSYFHLPSNWHGYGISPDYIRVGAPIYINGRRRKKIVAVGPQLRTALAARPDHVQIIYLHTLKPESDELRDLRLRAQTGRDVLWLEEANFDEFQHGYGTRDDHLRAVGLTPERVREFFK